MKIEKGNTSNSNGFSPWILLLGVITIGYILYHAGDAPAELISLGEMSPHFLVSGLLAFCFVLFCVYSLFRWSGTDTIHHPNLALIMFFQMIGIVYVLAIIFGILFNVFGNSGIEADGLSTY